MVLRLRLGCTVINILVSQILVGYLCDATHFRGAQFWWEPNANNPSQINLTFRIAWRRDYSEKTVCDMSTIRSGALIGPVDAGYIMCVTNCDFRVGNMDFRCTDYSMQEGWTSGLRTHVVTFPRPGYYQISWRGRSWLEEVIRGANTDWMFLISVNTTRRADTGVMNSSPRSAVGTILRIQEGCNQTLNIPVSDPNGDVVQCRWAVDKECGGICGPPEGFVLYQQSCKIEFHSSAIKGKYAIALQIEDFRQSDIKRATALSSVPLQFIVEIYATYDGNVTVTPTKEQCNLAPVFLEPTPKHGECFPINVGSTYMQRIITRTKDINTSVREINTVSSIGMTKSEIDRYDNVLTDYYVNITWAPVQTQVGDSIFCFTAVDSAGISSEQRCIYLSISSSSPMATKATYQVQQQTIHVEFNQSIQMPTSSQTLKLYNINDQLILSVNTNNSQLVSYTNTSIIVQVPNQANLNGQYYILLPKGAVRGNQRCGPQSIAVTDKSMLSFNTDGNIQITTRKVTTQANSSQDVSNVTTLNPNQGTSNLTTMDPNQGISNLTTMDPNQGITNLTTMDPNQGVSNLTTVDQNQGTLNVTTVDPNQGTFNLSTVDPNQVTTNMTTADQNSGQGTSNLTTSNPGFLGSSNLTTGTPGEGLSNLTTIDPHQGTSDNSTSNINSSGNNNSNNSSLGTSPNTEPTSEASTQDNDYMWLIILVVIVVVLFIFLIVLAIVIRWRLNTTKSGEYARKERQDEYLRNLQYQTKIVGYDGPYAPNFHDIEVKFR